MGAGATGARARAGVRARAEAQAAGSQGRAERRRAGGSARDRRRRGAGVGAWSARPGRACARRLGVLAGQLGQVGALCTWLSFDSVFDRFDSELFLSHEMNTVHCKINFKKILN